VPPPAVQRAIRVVAVGTDLRVRVGPRRPRLRASRSGGRSGGGDDSRQPLQWPHVPPKVVRRYARGMRLLVSLATAAVVFLLSACQAGTPTSGQVDTPASPESTSEPAPTPTPTPDEPDSIVFTLDGLEYRIDGDEGTVAFEVEPMTAFLTELTDADPQIEDVEDWWGGETVVAHRYSWDGASFVVFEDSTWAPAAITAPSIGGVPVSTRDGIAVGSSREVVEALGPLEVWDEDGDGSFDQLGLEPRDVPNTKSLTRPGEPGEEYILVVISDGTVSSLQLGNDFSDL